MDILPELQLGTGTDRMVSVLQYSKYRIWLLCSRGIPPRILCEGSIRRCAVNFNVRRIIPRRRNRRYLLNSRHGVKTRKDELVKRKFSWTVMGTELRSSRRQGSQHNTELHWLQTKFPYIFWSYLQDSKWGKGNTCVIFKLIKYNSGTTDWIQWIYSVVQNI